MVFGRTHHDEELGVIEIGAAELPERAANGIDHAGGHIHRTEAAMGRVVGRSKLTGKETRQGLHLVAPGEKRKLLGIGLPNAFKPIA